MIIKSLASLLIDLFRKQRGATSKDNNLRFHDRGNVIKDKFIGSDYGREKENR